MQTKSVGVGGWLYIDSKRKEKSEGMHFLKFNKQSIILPSNFALKGKTIY